MNTFGLGAQIGGPEAGRLDLDQQLRNAFNAWSGDYTNSIREFVFLMRVDGSINEYTKLWNICGAQPAKRKRDWIEVEIGVPVTWWSGLGTAEYKSKLTDEIEKGFLSMVALLRRNHHAVDETTLMRDWRRIRSEYLASS